MQVKLNVMAVSATMLFVSAVSAQDLIVRIGHVGPISGGLQAVGKESENGVRMAIDDLNAKGVSIGGAKARFELVAQDDAASPAQAVTAAQRLVDAKVNGVVGHLTSGASIAASKVYDAAGIPEISPSSTSPKYTHNGYKTAFRVLADDTQVGGALGRYAVKEMKAARIALIDDGSPYGLGLADEFSKAVKAAGGSVIDTQSTNSMATNFTVTDFSAILTAVKLKNPDVVFFAGMNTQAGPMISQMKQLGIDAKFMGGDALCTNDLPERAAGAMADGQVVCGSPGGIEWATAEMSRFAADYKAKFGIGAQYYAPYAYDAVMIMADAMVRARSSDPAKYLPALAATSGYHGLSGTISFDDKGDIRNGAVMLFTYNGGKKGPISVVQ